MNTTLDIIDHPGSGNDWLDDKVFPYWREASEIGELGTFIQWLANKDAIKASLVLQHYNEFKKVYRLVVSEVTVEGEAPILHSVPPTPLQQSMDFPVPAPPPRVTPQIPNLPWDGTGLEIGGRSRQTPFLAESHQSCEVRKSQPIANNECPVEPQQGIEHRIHEFNCLPSKDEVRVTHRSPSTSESDGIIHLSLRGRIEKDIAASGVGVHATYNGRKKPFFREKAPWANRSATAQGGGIANGSYPPHPVPELFEQMSGVPLHTHSSSSRSNVRGDALILPSTSSQPPRTNSNTGACNDYGDGRPCSDHPHHPHFEEMISGEKGNASSSPALGSWAKQSEDVPPQSGTMNKTSGLACGLDEDARSVSTEQGQGNRFRMRDPLSGQDFWYHHATGVAEWAIGGGVVGTPGEGLGLLSQEEREKLLKKFERRRRKQARSKGYKVCNQTNSIDEGLREQLLRRLVQESKTKDTSPAVEVTDC
ncbi:unnamed protein product [Choristocarpus tenellus]